MESENALRHIAIIMDGNSRWAKKRGMVHVRGHKAGVERIRDMLTVCRDEGVEALTLFAFSSENWRRPAREVDALMNLFHNYLTSESPRLKEEGIRLRVIGGRSRFNHKVLTAIENAEELTREGSTHLVIAADYGGKWDIANAARTLATKVQNGQMAVEDINEDALEAELSLADLPPLDLLIRTGGEVRISNFLLWQAAYAELYFSPQLWPDFSPENLGDAISEFHRRQRRFGQTGDQVRGASGA
ncbi:polyprenyl diphosphate synthase [Gilvimarinus sp. F26214L]|uniref:polyprenyl diphosphate synthase n=1 Tax=Gilvimarinus sp. DZF01 TaxID=3461371 RepID=UPI004045A58B